MSPHDNLAEYVLGTLAPAEEAEVEAYLARSQDARAELRELQASLVALTESLPAATPRAEVWTNIQAQLAAERSETASRPVDDKPLTFRPARRSYANRLSWPLAACLGLVALTSLFWGFRSYSAYQKVAGETLLIAGFLAEPLVQKRTLRGPDDKGLGGVLFGPEGRALFVLDRAPGPGLSGVGAHER